MYLFEAVHHVDSLKWNTDLFPLLVGGEAGEAFVK